jgi:hypothetical protein
MNHELRILKLFMFYFEDDCWRAIAFFLSYEDLIALNYSCKYFTLHAALFEHAFQELCQKRWNLKYPNRILKGIGAISWKNAYEILANRNTIPTGLYTGKFNSIFGAARSKGCSCWIFVAHKPNTKLNDRTIEIRLCIQNTHHSMPIAIDTNDPGIHFYFRTADGQNTNLRVAKALKVSLIAKNGYKIDSTLLLTDPSSSILLSLYDFFVFSMTVRVPELLSDHGSESMEHEIDFLAAAISVHINVSIPVLSSRLMESHFKTHTLVVPFIDETNAWEHYVTLPGGVILLRQDCIVPISGASF